MKILSALILCGGLIVPIASADGFWTTHVIDGMRGEDVGAYCSLELDNNNRPHILYYSETDKSLKYAWQPWVNISSWKWTTIARNTGKWGSFWLDDKGNDFAFSCVNDSGALFLGSGYFRPGVRDSPSPAVSRIIHVDYPGNFRETALLLTHEGSWACSGVFAYNSWLQQQGGALEYFAIECCRLSPSQDCPGTPYIHKEVTPYYHGEGYSAVLKNPDNWNTGREVCYYNASAYTLEFVHVGHLSESGQISDIPTQVVDGGAFPAGMFCSMAYDGNGYPHISYQCQSDGSTELRYAWKDASGWHNVTVDNSRGAGDYTSLTFDKRYVPHISYIAGDNSLKYATLNESGWHVELIETAPAARFLWTSIETDNRDRPRIAYYDATNGDLKFAWWEPSIRLRPFR